MDDVQNYNSYINIPSSHIDLEFQYVFFDRILCDFKFGEYSDTILLNFNLV
jgi:hypothetical protein